MHAATGWIILTGLFMIAKIKCGLHDGGQIHDFLKIHLLHWLKALSLMRKVSEGVIMIFKLYFMLEICYDIHF